MKEEKLVRTKYDLVMFIYAGIEIFVFGGITYGWPNLVRALKNEKYFTEQCPTSPIVSLSNSTNTSGLVEQSLEEWSCSSQDDMFGLVYNIASVVTGIGNVAIGLAVDRLPMMVTRMIFMFLFLIGSVCISLSTPETGTLLIPGILMIRVGGFLMYYQNMRLANCAPRVKGTIITIYAGMFDSSSSLLYIIMVSYQAGFSVQLSFSIFAVALCIPLFMTLILFPMKSIDSDGKFKRFPEIAGCTINSNNFDDISTVDAEIIGTENTLKSQKFSEPTSEEKDLNIEDYECKKKGSCQEFLSKHNLTFILDRKFHFFLLVLSVLTLRKEFFVISYDAALVKSANGNKGLVEHYSAVFGIVQFFAILVTPIGGIIIDYSRSRGGHIIFACIRSGLYTVNRIWSGDQKTYGSLKAYVWQFAFTIFLSILLCICSFIQPIEIYYASNVIYVVCRALTYSIAAAYISDTYPMKMFGSILGTTETIGYLLSLLQYPLLIWSNGPLNQDYRVANGIILGLCVLAISQPINLFQYYNKVEKSSSDKKTIPKLDNAPEAIPQSTQADKAPSDTTVSINQ